MIGEEARNGAHRMVGGRARNKVAMVGGGTRNRERMVVGLTGKSGRKDVDCGRSIAGGARRNMGSNSCVARN